MSLMIIIELGLAAAVGALAGYAAFAITQWRSRPSPKAGESPDSSKDVGSSSSPEVVESPPSSDITEPPPASEAVESSPSLETTEPPPASETPESSGSDEVVEEPPSSETTESPPSSEAAESTGSDEVVEEPSSPEAIEPPPSAPGASESPSSAKTIPENIDWGRLNYTTLASAPSWSPDQSVSLYPPEYVDVERFNTLLGDAEELNWVGQPLTDIRKLFVKQVILDDETTIEVETMQVPGFIAISDPITVIDPHGKTVSAHEHIAQVLERDGLLIVTFQWDKERFGIPLDMRKPMGEELFQEAFLKLEAHHAGTLVPARRQDAEDVWIDSYGAHNEPGSYHAGLYGDDGFVAVAQRLVFPDFVTQEQARGYTDSIISWMGLLNPFIKFPKDYNGGDPTAVGDRAKLKELLKNGLLACLGDLNAVDFLNDPANMTYCAEFVYISLNTVLFPFNQAGLTAVLDGDAANAKEILAIQARHNRRRSTILSKRSTNVSFEARLKRNPPNPEFDAGNIAMPVVPEDLLPLDELMTAQGYPVINASLPFPPFQISHILRRAFRTLLPRYQGFDSKKITAAQVRMLTYLEQGLIQQLGLEEAPPSDPHVQMLHQFMELVIQQISREFDSYEAFDQVVDQIMAQADAMLVGYGDRTRFVPPRIYVDLGQPDNDSNLPQGWGFKLETVGALLSRRAIGAPEGRIPIEWRTIELQNPFMHGDDVKLFQGAMIKAGLSLTTDGIFGPASAQKVEEFQTQNGLEPTGKIDEATRQLLLSQ